MTGREHLWQGEWVGDDEVGRRLERLAAIAQNALATPPDVEVVLAVCDRLSMATGDPTVAEIGHLLRRDTLEHRLRRELATARPFRLTRPDPRTTVFEAWVPLGLLIHVTPAAVAVLSAVEGLLTGNVNVVLAANPPLTVMARLGELDPTGQVATRLVVLRRGAGYRRWLRLACAAADGVAVWGGESVPPYIPADCRLVRWEHKISVAYLTRAAWSDESTLAALANDVCRPGRSGPGTVYLDTDRIEDVQAFIERLGSIRIDAGTVRVVPLPRHRLMETLWPMRRRLRTVGVAGDRHDVAELSRAVLAAGALRVTLLGAMSGGYVGEPRDGGYPLQRYSRRVSVQTDERFATDACLDDLVATIRVPRPRAAAPEVPKPRAAAGSVLTKADAQRRSPYVAAEHAQLYLHSGGTTGPSAVSVFTYDDYDTHTRAAADGLLAAGLDPRHDRTANLFYSGQMYGGFISFFSILERLTAVQLPIAASLDVRAVAETLVEHRVDTLLGMPSYLWRLCRVQQAPLRAYNGIRKIFYAGEHLSVEQQRWLTEELGVEVVRSAAYACTDLGPLGYQCTHTVGTVHHLHTQLHGLEVLDLDFDRPSDAAGRLVFTTRVRRGQELRRYDLGDVGRWVPGDCGCGRAAPRFELLGRRGDLVRVAAHFIDRRRLVRLAGERLGYAGDVQLVVTRDGDRERLLLRLDEKSAPDVETARRVLLASYPELRSAVETEGLLRFAVETVDMARLAQTPNSGKLQAVIDLRPGS